jgi:phosphatidylglycerol:prolipoprotein diacylglycerol transferase
MVALGFLAALFFMTRLARLGFVEKLPEEGVSQLVLCAMLGGAFGARLAYVCEHWSAEYAERPFLEIFRFDKGGLMFYGGLIGAIVVIAFFSKVKKISLVRILDLCAVGLPLGHAFGRVGCFLNGCCFGRVCDSVISVKYPANSPAWWQQVGNGLIGRGATETLPILPSQLIEATANIILFAALFAYARKKPAEGRVAGAYLIAYAVIRFFTETLRNAPRMMVGPLTISQLLGLGVFAAGLALLLMRKKSPQ